MMKQFYCFHICLNKKPIGFFALDFSLDRHQAYLAEISGFCVLRNFFIDSRFQGNGYSTAALKELPQTVRAKFPGTSVIYLTVNFKNALAVKTYAPNRRIEIDVNSLAEALV